MLDSITKITRGDGYKQVQLTAAIIDKIFDTNNDGIQKELAILRVIGSSLLFFLTHYAISMRFGHHCKLSLQQQPLQLLLECCPLSPA